MTAINAQVSSRQNPVKQIQFATDGNSKPYISGIRIGRTWVLKYWTLFSLRVTNNVTTADLTQTSFTITGPTTNSAGVTTITAVGTGSYSNITLTLTITERDRGFAFGATVQNAIASTWAVMTLSWPRFDLYPYGDSEDCVGFIGDYNGCTIWKPQLLPVARTVTHPTSLYANLPLMAIYDAESKGVLAIRTDDETGQTKQFIMSGNTTSTKVEVVSHFNQRYLSASVGGAAQTKVIPTVVVEGFDSAAPDPYDVHWDIADWYKRWATNEDRPWVQKGKWRDRSDLSPIVKNVTAAFVHGIPNTTGAGFQTIVDDVTNLASYIGTSEEKGLIFHQYSWATTQFNSRSPDVFWDNAASNAPGTLNTTLTSYVRDGVTDIQTISGVTCMVYTWANTWDVSNVTSPTPALNYTGAFNYENYDTLTPGVGSVSIGSRSLRTYSDTVKVFAQAASPPVIPYAQTGSVLDFAQTAYVPYIQLSLFYRYLTAWNGDANGERPIGFYMDVAPCGPLPDGETVIFNDDPNNQAWTLQQYMAGLQYTIDLMRQSFRLTVSPDVGIPNIYFSCEGTGQEFIPTYDIQHEAYFDSPLLPNGNHYFGANVATYQYVFGEYIRVLNHSNPNIYTVSGGAPDALQVATTCVPEMTYRWLNVGVASVVSRVSGSALVPAPNTINVTTTPPAHSNDPVWAWMKTLNDTQTYTRKFFQGALLPSPGGTVNQWLRDYQKQVPAALATFLRTFIGRYKTMASLRLAADGVVGVIIANVVKANFDYGLGFRPTDFSASVTVDLATGFNRLPAGLKTVYVRNLSTGVRTALTTFRDSVSLTRTLAPFSVELLEVEVTGA